MKTSNFGLIGLLATTAVLVIGLHRLGGVPGLAIDWSEPVTWINNAAPEDAAGACLRTVGLATGYWVLASSLLYAMAQLGGRRTRPRWVVAVTAYPRLSNSSFPE